jgi:hypothetical protein
MVEGVVQINTARCEPATTLGGQGQFTAFQGVGGLTGLTGGLSFTDADGQYTLAQMNAFTDDYLTNLIENSTGNALSDAVDQYGNDAFYDAVDNFNDYIINNDNTSDYINSQPNFEDYEVLFNKIEMASPITPFEMAEFIDEYNYSPDDINDLIDNTDTDLIDNLGTFFNGSFANSVLGGFCANIVGVFGVINSFFTAVGSIEGLVKDALEFLNKIKNIEDPIKAIIEKLKVKALIENIKEKLVSMVEKSISKVMNIIKNFSIDNIVGSIETFVNQQIVKRFLILRDSIARTFSKENVESLLNRLRQNIDYGVSLFENPSKEEILFLVTRFCGLAALLEQIISDRKLPLEQFVAKYEGVYARVKSNANMNTRGAINAGRPVLSPERRQELINTYKPKWEADENFRVPTVAEQEAVPSFQSLVDDANGKVYVSASQSQWVGFMKEEGWEGVDIGLRCILLRVQERFGRKLYINSGKRSVQYQALLREQAKARGESAGRRGDYGVSYTSNHLDGYAIDTHWTGFPNGLQDFIDIAKEECVRGFILYNTFIHIDVGRKQLLDFRSAGVAR